MKKIRNNHTKVFVKDNSLHLLGGANYCFDNGKISVAVGYNDLNPTIRKRTTKKKGDDNKALADNARVLVNNESNQKDLRELNLILQKTGGLSRVSKKKYLKEKGFSSLKELLSSLDKLK